MSTPSVDDRWFAWERARRLTSQLQAALRQTAVLVDQLAEAIEAAEPPGNRPS